MQLTRDNGETAITRDIRNVEAMLVAGFELCFAMLSEILENQKQGIAIDPVTLNQNLLKQRQLFEEQLDRLRAERYFGQD